MSRRDRTPRADDDLAPRRRRRLGPWSLLAPIALILLTIAIFYSVGSVLNQPANETDSQATPGQEATTPASTGTVQTTETVAEKPRSKRQFVVVQAGDSPSSIAEEHGLTTEEFLTLNPDIDPQALPTGVKVRIRPAPDTKQ